LAVVAFHFEAPGVFGGFVGVDIFFVISGYLITGIIQSELQGGTFSFARFYERRVRRLLPALYAMVVLTAIPSFHYLLTSERAEFFRSAIAALTFTSNFFFWFQTGYFDHAAVEKPLLHTWSLAVEEQFYLAMPLMLWALLRFARNGRARVSGYSYLQPSHYRPPHSAESKRKSTMKKPARMEVVCRAYELWEKAGKSEGLDQEFYHQAEREWEGESEDPETPEGI